LRVKKQRKTVSYSNEKQRRLDTFITKKPCIDENLKEKIRNNLQLPFYD